MKKILETTLCPIITLQKYKTSLSNGIKEDFARFSSIKTFLHLLVKKTATKKIDLVVLFWMLYTKQKDATAVI